MESIESIFLNIFSMSTIAIIIFALILILRSLFKDKISISKSIMLWSIFIIILIFPFNFESRLSIKNYLQTSIKKENNILEEFILEEEYENFGEILGESKESIKTSRKNSLTYLSIFWLCISIFLIIKDMYFYNKLLRKTKIINLSDKHIKLLEMCKQRLDLNKNITLVFDENIQTPSLCGIFFPKILLAKELLELPDEEIECVLIHELIHYKKKHHLLYILFTLLKDVHWFNPIVHYAIKLIKNDIEVLVDENVLLIGIEKKKYCKMIVKIASIASCSKISVPTICNDKKEIERRIIYMKFERNYTKIATVFLIISILGISLISVSLATDKVNENVDIYEKNQTLIETSKNVEKKVEFAMPLKDGKISLNFGRRIHPITKEERFHSGIDIATNEGEEVFSIASGKVVYADYDTSNGNMVRIKHNDGSISVYKHGMEILVEVGDNVEVGEKIMLVGKTGMATGPHLHLEVIDKNGEFVNINYLFE